MCGKETETQRSEPVPLRWEVFRGEEAREKVGEEAEVEEEEEAEEGRREEKKK